MNFDTPAEEADLRSAVRSLCAKYPDEYWAEHDAKHQMAWDFYRSSPMPASSASPSPKNTAAAAQGSPKQPRSSRKSPPLAAPSTPAR